jgi:hypothetical protein
VTQGASIGPILPPAGTGGGGGSGTVTSFGFTNGNGVTGTVATPTTTPQLSFVFATQSPGDNTTNLATTAFVTSAVSTAGALYLLKANNLSDVPTKGTGRFNLWIPSLASAQAAAVANVNIASAPASVDGFSFLSSGLDTVLLTAQTVPSQNGPWVWNGAGSALTRPSDWPSAGVVTTGRIISIQNGTVYAGSAWYIAVPSAGITTDTTAETWALLANPTYAPLASPALTGTPTAPTAAAGTATTQIATTAFVTAADVVITNQTAYYASITYQ